jgi:hypothetical protein
MKSGTQKSLIAGSVGLVALGTIALTKRRRSAMDQTEDAGAEIAGEIKDTGTEFGQSIRDMPEVMEMPAPGEARAASMDPAIE